MAMAVLASPGRPYALRCARVKLKPLRLVLLCLSFPWEGKEFRTVQKSKRV
jgi:hypothetical protein